MNRRGLWIASALIVLGTSVAASAALSTPTDARVSFLAVGPAGMKIEGTTSELTLVEKDGNLVVEVPLANLTTGIALRDHHMKDKYLETGKYPSATLVVPRSTVHAPASGARASEDVAGTVTIHGQSRPVTVHYEATGEAGGSVVDGRFHVRMNEFGITVPTYLGVTVKPDVDVTARFHVAGT
jgi:polyisoprenoid-binding protein YceI